MNRALLTILLCLNLSILSEAQFIQTTSSWGCVNVGYMPSTETVFYLIGTSCNVPSLASWTVPGAATVNSVAPGNFNAIRVTWASSGSKSVSVLCGSTTFNLQAGPFTVHPAVTQAIAGPDQIDLLTCGKDKITLAATPATVGSTGQWTFVNSGDFEYGVVGFSPTGGAYETTQQPNSFFYGHNDRDYNLRWTVSSSYCGSNSDDVVIRINSNATAANISACAPNASLFATPPSGITGQWQNISGGGSISSPTTNPTATFSGVQENTYTLRWTLTNGPCAGSFDDISVILHPSLVHASFTVNGNSLITSSQTGSTVQFVLSQFVPDQTYELDWGDGTIVPVTSTNPIEHIYNSAGYFNVVCRTTRPGTGCLSGTGHTVGVADCPELLGIDILSEPYLCTTKFSVPPIKNCLSTYTWNFGDGSDPANKNKRNPFHTYAAGGQYNVSVSIHYDCATLNCVGDTTLTKQVTIPNYNADTTRLNLLVTTDQRLEVINSTTSSFSDAWPLQYEASAITDQIGYWNGSAGVWRNNAAYAYKVPRSQSEGVNLKQDGTYTMAQFDWAKADLNGIPNWIKANSITEYSPYGFELENKDVLGVYSAAVYDYKGQLPVANGVNMRHKEIAFTGFETKEVELGNATGNWLFGSLPPLRYETFVINSGSANMAVVEAPQQKLQYPYADVYSRSLTQSGHGARNNSTFLKANKIVCSMPYPQSNQWSLVVFEQAPNEPLWMGKMVVKNLISVQSNPLLDSTVAHTGKKSLQIATNTKWSQNVLKLDSGKTYKVSAWVTKVGAAQSATTSLGDLGLILTVKRNGVGNDIGLSYHANASGPIIEGWQQINGEYTCPINNAVLQVTFKAGSSIAWYDDLRIHPKNGNMKSYVYDPQDFRLKAILDEENFASFFYYDAEGNLYLTKKETVDGIKTLTENISYQIER